MNELKYEILHATRGKVPYIAGADWFSVYKKKNVVSNPTNLEEHKSRVRPRNQGG